MKNNKIIMSCLLIMFVGCISSNIINKPKAEKKVLLNTIDEWNLKESNELLKAKREYELLISKRNNVYISDITNVSKKVEIYPRELYLLNRNDVPEIYRLFVIKLARYYRIDSHVLISLVQIESKWGKSPGYNTIEGRGYGPDDQWADIGLGQLNSRYHDHFELENFNKELLKEFGHDVEEFDATNGFINLQITASLINEKYNIFGNYDEALMAYNAGEYAVKSGLVGFSSYSISRIENYVYSIINNKSHLTEKI